MATITRFDPFREMLTLRHAMDRLFDDSVVSAAGLRTLAIGHGFPLNPPLDIRETGDDLVVTMSLPGLGAEDVSITITGQSLQIRGELKADESAERDGYLHRERRFGAFNRQLQLPVRVQGEKAGASFENGVLTLTIPKAEEVKPRQIEIKTATGATQTKPAEAEATGATQTTPVEADGGARA
jgi:HSP20 family protein